MSIYLIRHAQSEFNAAYGKIMRDPMIFDAPLSDLGITQAVEVRDEVERLNLKNVIVSPLTRTLETAELIFQRSLPTKVNALVREQLSHSGDVGTHPDILAKNWAHLDFSHLEDHWWHKGDGGKNGITVEPLISLEQRAAEFVAFAKQMKLHSTAIVTHGNFIRALTGVQPDNCQVLKLEI
ncbi:MAG: phosphoglycerate mutase family protein [Devosiaceae bacterium]|nr:phosphoglycerate mutase family protein [Devosiaceae bacterium]